MKRRAIRLVLYIFAGAIINVAVAWGIAYRTAFDSMSPIGSRDGSWFVWPEYLRKLNWPAPTMIEDYEVPGLDVGVTLFDVSGGDADAGWRRTDSPDKLHVSLLIYQFGFPARGLKLETHGIRAGPRSMELVKAAHAAAGWRAGLDITKRELKFLPLTPIWPGFAINTIFYAAIVWMLFAVPGAVRRRARIKRGQCASCGYSLRENVSEKCPECGATIPSRSGRGRGGGEMQTR